MEINNSGPIRSPHFQSGKARNTDTPKADSTVSRPDASLTSIDTGTTEGIKALLSESAGVRETLVDEIKLKIQSGDYLTKRAAYEAADAILNL